MRLILFFLVLLLIGGSVYFDYRWKRWVARRREERERSPDNFR